MRPPENETPIFLIVAGPNGSGKSSVYRDTGIELEGRSWWIVNPDLLTATISQVEGLDTEAANLAAVQRLEAWLEASINVHKSIGVETVLSTPKYRRLVELAKGKGFAIWLFFVILDDPDRNIERVKLRVMKGGHAVPDDKVRSRYARSLQNFPWFLEQADRAWIFDNSKAEPRQIGAKENGVVTLDKLALPAVVDAVNTIRSG